MIYKQKYIRHNKFSCFVSGMEEGEYYVLQLSLEGNHLRSNIFQVSRANEKLKRNE